MGAAEPALDRLAHVGQQMPSVRHLNRAGRSKSDAAGILGRPVAGDDRDPGRCCNQSVSVAALRSGSRSTTRCRSRSTIIVP
jgi:hypothetical protein